MNLSERMNESSVENAEISNVVVMLWADKVAQLEMDCAKNLVMATEEQIAKGKLEEENAVLLRVARAADDMRIQMERANETWESLNEAELDFGELFEALKELPEGLLEVVK